jgi:hypothetical protein
LSAVKNSTSGHAKSVFPRLQQTVVRDDTIVTSTSRNERGFSDRGFANWRFPDWGLSDLRLLVNRLRTRKICSGGGADKANGRGSDNEKFQHLILLRAT